MSGLFLKNRLLFQAVKVIYVHTKTKEAHSMKYRIAANDNVIDQ